LRSTGDRIETLLEASSSGGVLARERAEELVRLVADLYGAGLERMMDILYEEGVLTDAVLDRYAADDLVASLLLVHGLHPYDVETRVQRALDTVRPYLASHGGDVELLGITGSGVVRLRLLGSCDGCASSSATMSLAVEDAVSSAAPEVTGFEVDSPSGPPAAPARGLIPLEVVRHEHPAQPDPGRGAWRAVPGATDLPAGGLLGTTVAGVAIIVCRIGADLFAFRDECARCGATLADAVLERRMGAAVGTAILRCPSCRSHYDVRQAGMATDHSGSQLAPLPLLSRQGRIEVAVPARDTR
jgi:Fe-S cluster biogenesis protein NfuA/nitrite reductase/ring-hydroxylating ferredoxin subunit